MGNEKIEITADMVREGGWALKEWLGDGRLGATSEQAEVGVLLVLRAVLGEKIALHGLGKLTQIVAEAYGVKLGGDQLLRRD